MNIKGAIFDLDGTLLDSMPFWFSAEELYLKTKGIVPNPQIKKDLREMTLSQASHYFQREFGFCETEEETVLAIRDLMRQEYEKSIPLKPGAEEFLIKLQQQNVKMCIATATDRELAQMALCRLGIQDYFFEVLSCWQTGAGKNHPDIYLQALSLLETALADTVVFEDAPHAIITAKSAGFCVAAMYEESIAAGQQSILPIVDWYLHSFNDLDPEAP